MNAVIVYESMYGNTHLIAEAIAEGLRAYGEATVAAVHEVDGELVRNADVLVVGGPTHAHGMSHAATRKGAIEAAEKPGADLDLDADPDAYGVGLREWFGSVGDLPMKAAAFDTRFEMPATLTGRASKGIARKLRHHGATMIADPESFFVTKANQLEPDEDDRARAWGEKLGIALGANAPN